MLAGVVAGVLAFGFALVVGEPQVDAAIRLESLHSHNHDDDAIVSRALQGSAGLGTATLVYGVAVGGVFAIVFALAHGRIGTRTVRGTAAVIGAVGIVAIHLVPGVKYPAEPPGIGDPDAVGRHTALYVLMVTVSLVGATVAVFARPRLAKRLGEWDAGVVAATGYFAVVALCAVLLPTADASTTGFPADLMWRFRLASIGLQLVTWAAIALAFGMLADRLYRQLP